MINNRKALVVGINDYPSVPLSGCINDAEQIAELLETNYDDSKNFDVMSHHSPTFHWGRMR